MRYLDITLSTAHTLYSDESHLLQNAAQTTDLLIGAVLVPGAKAPKLIRREMLKLMPPGQRAGGTSPLIRARCAETFRPPHHA